jgi:hypothetical protein
LVALSAIADGAPSAVAASIAYAAIGALFVSTFAVSYTIHEVFVGSMPSRPSGAWLVRAVAVSVMAAGPALTCLLLILLLRQVPTLANGPTERISREMIQDLQHLVRVSLPVSLAGSLLAAFLQVITAPILRPRILTLRDSDFGAMSAMDHWRLDDAEVVTPDALRQMLGDGTEVAAPVHFDGEGKYRQPP